MSVTGGNIRKILAETRKDDIFKVKVSELKRDFKFCAIGEGDKWKVEVIKELTNVKQGSVHIDDENGGNLLTTSEIEEIINYVFTC